MGFLCKLIMKAQGNRINWIAIQCADLRAIGLDALAIESSLPEEGIDCGVGGGSWGLIQIRNSPIQWINTLRAFDIGGPGVPAGGELTEYVYIIPDSAIRKEGYLELESVRIKERRHVGQVVDFRWQGNFEGDIYLRMATGVIPEQAKKTLIEYKDDIVNRLDQDRFLKQTLIGLGIGIGIKIRSYPEHGCWALLPYNNTSLPSREQWKCYESIACHLLESREE